MQFKDLIRIKPEASLQKSEEFYYLAKGFKNSYFWELLEKNGKDITWP